jgi:hypothetical protein
LIGHALIAVRSVGLEISETTFQFRITNICTNLISMLGRAIVNKADLIETLRSETGLSRSKAEAVVELFFDEMSKALAKWRPGRDQGLVQHLRQGIQGLHWAKPKNRKIYPGAI